jgi:hypothetical protein
VAEIMDFDQWFANYKPPVVEHYAIFDESTGSIKAVYPGHACENLKNKILVDTELAESLLSGKISLSSCMVDFASDEPQILQKQGLRKIDDIFHRVIDKRYSDVEDPDVLITYNLEKKKIVFQISESYKKRKYKWDASTNLNFIVSEYNDPHLVKVLINIKLEDLLNKNVEIDFDNSGNKFSIFTRRILKKYLFQTV